MESTPEQTAEGVAVVRVLAAVLERLVNANAQMNQNEVQVTKFHALRAPSIGILQYLERIHKYASCSTESFILALIYLDRLIQRNNFILTQLNAHRVIISAVLVAAKFFDDAYYNNAYYAKVGGVTVSELNSLEVEFLFRINFALHVSPELYRKYHEELLSHAVTTNSSSEVTLMLAAAAHLVSTSSSAESPATTVGRCADDLRVKETYASVPQAPFVTFNHNSSNMEDSAMILVVPAHDNERRIMTPSPSTTSSTHPYGGPAQQFPVSAGFHPTFGIAQQQLHHVSMPDKYVSNLAAQLQQHQLYQNSMFPPRAVSATVSLSDVDENEPCYHQQRQNSQFVRQHFPAYHSSNSSTPSLAPTTGSCSTQGHPLGYRPTPQQAHHHQAHIVESVYVAGGGGIR